MRFDRAPTRVAASHTCGGFQRESLGVVGVEFLREMRAAALVIALVVAAGCEPVCSSAPTATAPAQHLVFSGAVAGTLTTATTSCTTYTDQKQANFELDGALGGKQLTFHIQVNGYTGPRSYPVGSILDGAAEIRSQIGDVIADSTTGAGTVTVNPDGRSGSVTADLVGGEHVEGTWACDKVTSA
jgi:hypothetical protein